MTLIPDVILPTGSSNYTRFMKTQDIISTKVRGHMLKLADYLTPSDVLDCWHSAGYRNLPLDAKGEFDSESRRIFRTYSRYTDWTNKESAQMGVDAFELIYQRVMIQCGNSFELGEDLYGFDERLRECGLVIGDNHEFLWLPVVGDGEVPPNIFKQPNGVAVEIERINRAIQNGDAGEVLAKAKSLMESVARAIIYESDPWWAPPKNQGIFEQTARKAQEVLEIKSDKSDPFKMAVYSQCENARKIAVAGKNLRNSTGGDHGHNPDQAIERAHVRLAIDAALLWVRYMTSMHEARQNAQKWVPEPPPF